MRFRRTTGYPDYFPDVPGANVNGRGVESVVFDTTLLGDWAPERVVQFKGPERTHALSLWTIPSR